MTFTASGDVCFSNNPIPPPALEGATLQIVCIDPDYEPQADSAALTASRR